MDKARSEGKCKFIGLSAVRPLPPSALCPSSPARLLIACRPPAQMSANTLRRASKVAKIDFVEMEFSCFDTATIEVRPAVLLLSFLASAALTRPPAPQKSGVLDACKELGVKIFAYSPLGKGFLTGRFRKWEDVDKEGDFRGKGAFPRLNKEHWDANFRLVEGASCLASALPPSTAFSR